MSEKTIVEGIAGVVRTYELMDRVRTRQDLVIRDDQFDYETLARRRPLRRPAALPPEPPRYGAVRSDPARGPGRGGQPHPDLGRSAAASRRMGGARPGLPRGRDAPGRVLERPAACAGPGRGPLSPGPHRPPRRGARSPHRRPNACPRPGDPDRARRRGEEGPGAISSSTIPGRSSPELAGPAGRRAWVHFSDHDAAEKGWAGRAAAIARAASAAGSRAVVHVERGLDLETFAALWDAGAALVVLTPPSDDRSLLRPLEERARRRKVPARAFYLSTAFLP
ncbi:MAG: hypothetical protein MZW92_10310 [Comamonadaceae bacterium]|nr:hypothetical protein [Comamonadaceae bacterium]